VILSRYEWYSLDPSIKKVSGGIGKAKMLVIGPAFGLTQRNGKW